MIFLHIGAQKTGSTTIQKALYDCRDELKSQNLYYANSFPSDNNKVSHYNSVRGFFSNYDKDKDNTKSFLSQFDDTSKNYIVSAENLSNWPSFKPGETLSGVEYSSRKREIVRGIKEALAPHDVTVVFYTRKRSDFLKSLFKQHLKVNYEEARSIDQSLHRFMERETVRSDFAMEADIWKGVFDSVHLVDYDSYQKSGLLDSFSEILHYSSTLQASEDLNISPNWDSLEIRRIKNTLGAELQITDYKKARKFSSETEKYVTSVISSYLANASPV